MRRRCWGCCAEALSGTGREGHAGDGGVVVEEADVVPGVQEAGEGVALTEADLEGQQATGTECVEGAGDEAAEEREAVASGEESEVRFVVADLGREGEGV